MANESGHENSGETAAAQGKQPVLNPELKGIAKQNYSQNGLNSNKTPKVSELRAHKLRGISSRRRKIKRKGLTISESEFSLRKLWVDDDYKALKQWKQRSSKRRRRPISGKPLNRREMRGPKRRIQRTKMKLAKLMAKVPAKLLFARRKGKVNVFNELDLND